MMQRTSLYSILAASVLLLGAVAVPAMAQDADDHAQNDTAKERREAAQEHREAAKNASEERKEAIREHVKEAKGHRAEHVLVHAISAHEHRLERLQAAYDEVNASLAQDNLSANETAELQHRLDRIGAAIERAQERMDALGQKREALLARWGAEDSTDDVDDQDEDPADGNETVEGS